MKKTINRSNLSVDTAPAEHSSVPPLPPTVSRTKPIQSPTKHLSPRSDDISTSYESASTLRTSGLRKKDTLRVRTDNESLSEEDSNYISPPPTQTPTFRSSRGFSLTFSPKHESTASPMTNLSARKRLSSFDLNNSETTSTKGLGSKKSSEHSLVYLQTSPANSPKITSTKDLKLLPYATHGGSSRSLEGNIRTISYKPGATRDQESDQYSTKLPFNFYDKMHTAAYKHKTLYSFRLHADPARASNRRYSLIIDGIIVASPKEPCTSTQTNPSATFCTGHLPRDKEFLHFAHSLTDNNFAGEYPEEVVNTPGNIPLLTRLRRDDSDKISEAKTFQNLICYIEATPGFTKLSDGTYNATGDTIDKHYIQEFESVHSIIERIEANIYKFVCVFKNRLEFIVNSGHTCCIMFDRLTPASTEEYTVQNTKGFAEFKKHVYDSLLHKHAPVFYRNSRQNFVPVMVQAGSNGFHIAGDADPQHFGIRSDMPWMVHKQFDARKTMPITYIQGLNILIARLSCATVDEFLAYANNDSLPIDKFMHPLELQADNYIDYTNIEYYRDTFLPLTRLTLFRYLANPDILLRVGVSRIYTIIMLIDFDHPLTIHGEEDIHPKSKTNDFGAILVCYKDHLSVTADEGAYIDYLFHNRAILNEQFIGVHPHWLREREESNLSLQWQNIIEAQALYAARRGAFNLEMYIITVTGTLQQGRESDKYALDTVNSVFGRLRYIAGSVESINQRLDSIYLEHVATSEVISTLLRNITFKFSSFKI